MSFFHRSYGPMDETMDDLMDITFSNNPPFLSLNSSSDELVVNDEVIGCINEILDSVICVEDTFESFERRENATTSMIKAFGSDESFAEDLPEDAFLTVNQADDMKTVESAFDIIDDALLKAHIPTLPNDSDVYKAKYSFPSSFATDEDAAKTYDSLIVENKNFDEALFDTHAFVESSIRPNMSAFKSIDESQTKNEGFNHTAGFTDYDKLATKKKKPDGLFYSVLPKDIFKENCSDFECNSKYSLNLKMLIEEFRQYLNQPINNPYSSSCQLQCGGKLVNDGWDVKELNKHHHLRQFFQNLNSGDETLEWFFQELGLEMVPTDEGLFSGKISDDVVAAEKDKGHFKNAKLLSGLKVMDDYSNPYASVPSLSNYNPELPGERDSCVAIMSNHPGKKPVPMKLYAPLEYKEYFLGLPFDYAGARAPYHHPRVVDEYMNHLIVRIAINRYIANHDDSLAHFIFNKLFITHPEPFFAQEAFRMFIHPSRSLTHQEVYALAQVSHEYKAFDSTLHFLLAVSHLREKNEIAMEEEIFNFCYSQRYSMMDKDYNPFPENSEIDKGTYKDNSEAVFNCVREALVYNTYLSILGMKYKRAREIVARIEQLDLDDQDEEHNLHWCLVMNAQAQVCQLNPYVHEPGEFFMTRSEFFLVSSTDNHAELESLMETCKGRIESCKEEELCSPEMLKEFNYRFLVIQYILLQYYSLSSKEEIVKGFYELLQNICSGTERDPRLLRLERLAKTLARSYYLSLGINNIPAVLTLVEKPQIVRDNYDGYSSEAMMIDGIMNSYELAYAGNFQEALKIITNLEEAHLNALAGSYNLRIARACIEFDNAFFNKGEYHCTPKLKKLYEYCPIEALLREIPYSLMYGEITKSMIRRLYWIAGHCSLLHVLPTHQLRSHLALYQIFMEMKKYQEAVDILKKGRKLAKALNMTLFRALINRRLALAYSHLGHFNDAFKKLDKCPIIYNDVKLPQLEIAMTYFTKYFVHRAAATAKKRKQPKGIMTYPVLSEYLRKSSIYFKPFKHMYKWMLVEEFHFIVHGLKAASRSDLAVLQKHKQQLQPTIIKVFGFESDFNIDTSPKNLELVDQLKRLHTFPVHLI